MTRSSAAARREKPRRGQESRADAPLPDDTPHLTGDGDSIPSSDRTAMALKRALSPRIQLLRRLAGGGMSVVYLGRDPNLRRLVAIKVLSEELSQDPVARARFTREAEAAAAIVDPHVIEIYQVGTLSRTEKPYIIMQYVDGLTLQQEILDGNPAPEALAKAVVGEVASGLAAAHEKGVVHRDIKPANIILDRATSRAVVLDFGISAVVSSDSAPDVERLTRQGVSVGTPAYMSPEQSAAKDVTDRSDVYSLGIVAFEFVTGQLPFKADAPEGYLAAHLQDQPPDVRTLRPDLDKQFANLINRCLSKVPEERPAAAEIARAYIPSARLSVEWPPPGLDALRGMGWRQLKTLLASAAAGLAFFALLLVPPGSRAFVELTTPGTLNPLVSGSSTSETVWLFLLGATILVTVPLTAVGRVRGWKLAALLKWARGLGYPWPVLLDVALDGPDTAALVNGYGVFALESDAKRRRMLSLKRLRAFALLATVAAAVLGPTLWACGIGRNQGPTAGPLITLFDAVVIFAPTLAVLLGAVLLGVPEWLVRHRAGRWGPFGPLGWSLPPMRPEIVTEWLNGIDREPSPPAGHIVRSVGAMAPVAAGGALSMVLFLILMVVLTSIVTTSQWNAERSESAAALSAPRTGPPSAEALRVLATSGRPARTGWIPTGDPTTLFLASARARATLLATDPQVDGRRLELWRELPGSLPAPAVADLTEDASNTQLDAWRNLAYSGRRGPPVLRAMHFDGVLSPYADLEMLSHGAALELARSNEAAALLAMTKENRDVALRHARENIAIGAALLRDPVNGWVGPEVVEIGSRAINEVGLISGDRALLLEALELRGAVPSLAGSGHSVRLESYSALMIDPADLAGLAIVGDTSRFAYERWWAIAGIVPGFCGNPREVLFGVDPRRGDLLTQAGDLATDIGGTQKWIDLNRRALERWTGKTDTVHVQLPKYLIPLKWVRLEGLANRLAFCAGSPEQTS